MSFKALTALRLTACVTRSAAVVVPLVPLLEGMAYANLNHLSHPLSRSFGVQKAAILAYD